MTKAKFVMVSFSDGDYRVYRKRNASQRTIKSWERGVSPTAEVVAENTDKDALVAMARIAREAFLAEWEDEDHLVDRTEVGDFP